MQNPRTLNFHETDLLMSGHLRELLAELPAITVWARDYLSRLDHDGIDRAGWEFAADETGRRSTGVGRD